MNEVQKLPKGNPHDPPPHIKASHTLSSLPPAFPALASLGLFQSVLQMIGTKYPQHAAGDNTHQYKTLSRNMIGAGLVRSTAKARGAECQRIAMEAITLQRVGIQKNQTYFLLHVLIPSTSITFYSDPLYYSVVLISSLLSFEQAINQIT